MAAQNPVKKTAIARKFDIQKVPFYKAVMLFETEKYQDAFDIFVEIAKKGNLYAPFYIQYMMKNRAVLKLTIKKENAEFLEEKTVAEYISMIPRELQPQSWCEASLIIIQCKKTKKPTDALLRQLLTFEKAANALVYVFEVYEKDKARKSDFVLVMNKVMAQCDLWCLLKISEYRSQQIERGKLILGTEYIEQEKTIVDKSDLAYNLNGGQVERLLAKMYLSSKLPTVGRTLNWQIKGAYLGDLSLQRMFAGPEAKRTDADMICWLKVAAYHGDVQAQVVYGRHCYNGDHPLIPKNKMIAGSYYEKILSAAEHDLSGFSKNLLPEILCNMGVMHEHGEAGYVASDIEAFKFYQQAAQTNSYKGHSCVAIFAAQGRGGLAKSYTLAMQHYTLALTLVAQITEKARDKAAAYLHFQIAELHEEGGFGIERDEQEAIKHYALAAPIREDAAQCYTRMLQLGQDINTPDEASDVGALKLYQQAAEANSIKGHIYVSVFAMKGRGGLEKNYKLAIDHCIIALKLAAELKEEKQLNTLVAYIHFSMAKMYKRGGFGIERDEQEALTHYALAAPVHEEAAECYALMLWDGTGLSEPDKRSAINISIPLALKGHDRAAWVVSAAYITREVDLRGEFALAEQDIEKCLLLAKTRHPQVISWLASFYIAGLSTGPDYLKALPWLQEGGKLKQPQALYTWGWIYEKGCRGLNIEANQERAYEYYSLAASGDDPLPPALTNKGYMLMNGQGVKRDIEAAATCLKQALDLGHQMAAYNLYALYTHPSYTRAPDYDLGFTYLLQADPNDVDVLYNSGCCHVKGLGVQEDRKIALEKFETAANLGHPKAAYNFAVLKFQDICEAIIADKEFNQATALVLSDIVLKLEKTLDYKFAAHACLYAMLSLLQDCSKEQLSQSLQTLRSILRIKPHKKSQVFLQCLEEKDEVSFTDMFALCLYYVPKVRESILKMDQGKSKDASKPLPTKKPDAKSMAEAASLSTPSREAKLRTDIDEFLDPKNRKQLDFARCMTLVHEIEIVSSSAKESSGMERTKKGFRHIAKIAEGGSPAMLFMHPLHGRKGAKEGEDPKRARAMQDHLRQMAAALT